MSRRGHRLLDVGFALRRVRSLVFDFLSPEAVVLCHFDVTLDARLAGQPQPALWIVGWEGQAASLACHRWPCRDSSPCRPGRCVGSCHPRGGRRGVSRRSRTRFPVRRTVSSAWRCLRGVSPYELPQPGIQKRTLAGAVAHRGGEGIGHRRHTEIPPVPRPARDRLGRPSPVSRRRRSRGGLFAV